MIFSEKIKKTGDVGGEAAGESGVLGNVEAMLEAPGTGLGPDIVIIVSSTEEGAVFWQKRLTGSDDIHGSGTVVKPSAMVFSVSESNWHGPAGNALGTINAFREAGIMAMRKGILRTSGEEFTCVFRSFLELLKNKSVFMFHTAGKGTRLSPLTAAEHNSKSRIKLPGIIQTKNGEETITVLEAAIRAASIYAASRENRLSVFWGDQVLLSERASKLESKHHVELFAHSIELNDTIKSYGIIIPGENGDCLLREKLSASSVRKMFPEIKDNVYRSIGSFSVSFEFFELLAMSEKEAALSKKGTLNTDSDWWQAITSAKEEYIELLSEKGIQPDAAEKRWSKTRKICDSLASNLREGVWRRNTVGFKDTGKNSLWMDYGRNDCFFKNILLLAGESIPSREGRAFFGSKKTDSSAISSQGNSIVNSVVVNSRLGHGKLKNCVVISSDIEDFDAENSVIIGSDIIKFNSKGALCYNVVSPKEVLKENEILVNIFHPDKGRIVMKTDLSRDGQEDWAKNLKIMDNVFSYKELTELVSVASEEEILKTRRSAVMNIKKGRKTNE